MKRNDEDDRVEELVAMIDELMAKGDGHVNVTAGEELSPEDVTPNVQTVRSNDCTHSTQCMPGACCQPNEKAPDDED